MNRAASDRGSFYVCFFRKGYIIGNRIVFEEKSLAALLKIRRNAVSLWRRRIDGNVGAAKKTFVKYKKCTDVYCAYLARGKPIERLTVADWYIV